VRATFKGFAAVVAPTSAVTALLYYFGWTRTNVEATALGLDDSLFGYSVQDYLLRSMSSMFAPLVVGLLATLAAIAFHTVLLSRARNPGRDGSVAERVDVRVIRRAMFIVAASGLLLLIAGYATNRLDHPSEALYVASPVAVTVGVVCLVYSANLYRNFILKSPSTVITYERFSGVVSGSIVVLLILCLFWSVSHFAVVKGLNLAAEVERSLSSRPGVVVYSEKRLYLQPPVVETALDPDGAAYNYAYTKLRLLFESDGKYFLRPDDPTQRVNIVLADGPDIRLEYYEP
jgi:hypothetical protein